MAIVAQLLIVVVVVDFVVFFAGSCVQCALFFLFSIRNVRHFSHTSRSLAAASAVYLYTHFCSTGFPIIGRIVTISPSRSHDDCPFQSVQSTGQRIGQHNAVRENEEEVTREWDTATEETTR